MNRKIILTHTRFWICNFGTVQEWVILVSGNYGNVRGRHEISGFYKSWSIDELAIDGANSSSLGFTVKS